MCGRFSNSISESKLEKYFSRVRLDELIQASYNICPTDSCLVLKNEMPYVFSKMSWGFLPFGKSDGNVLINARSETIFEKPSFKHNVQDKRCLVIADSFYEWKKVGKDRMPYRIHLRNDEIMVFAGIYHEWISNGNHCSGFVILTNQPNKEMSKIHNRAPVILETKEKQMAWISDISSKNILELTEPLADNSLHIYKVSKAVGKTSNNSIDLHCELPEQPTLF